MISPAPLGEHNLPSQRTPPAQHTNHSSPCKLCLLNTPCSLNKPGYKLCQLNKPCYKPCQLSKSCSPSTSKLSQLNSSCSPSNIKPCQLSKSHPYLPTQQVLPILQTLPTQFAASVLLPIICNPVTPCSSACPAATADTPRWVHRLCCITGQKLFVDATQHTTQPYTHKLATISLFSSWMHAWSIYLTVILTYNPTRALELVVYQRIITSADHSL